MTSARQSGVNPSVRWWPVTGGGENVIVEEAALGADLAVSQDGKWVVFLRQFDASADGGLGTLAFAATTGAPNVANLDTNVGGFGFFASSELAYMKLPSPQALGQLRRFANLGAPVSVLTADNVFPDGIRLSNDGTRFAALRDTNVNSVEELWTGLTDGSGWVMVDERPNIHVDGDAAFSPTGTSLVWQWGLDDSPSMPKALMISKIPAQGMPLSTQVGSGVSQWDFTDADGLISAGQFPIDRTSGGVLRIFDGNTVPGQVVQSSVGERFAIVNDRVLFTVDGNGNSNGAYILNLAQPPATSTCDPVSQAGCPAGQACLVQGTGDIAGCGPAGTAPLGASCSTGGGCAAGLQCVNGSCLRLCDAKNVSCPAGWPFCQLAPGNARYGACMTNMMGSTDAGAPPAMDAGTMPPMDTGPPPQMVDAAPAPDGL